MARIALACLHVDRLCYFKIAQNQKRQAVSGTILTVIVIITISYFSSSSTSSSSSSFQAIILKR